MGEREVLLKIKREFTEDESINYMSEVISNLRKEIGILRSELAESEYQYKNAVTIKPKLTDAETIKLLRKVNPSFLKGYKSTQINCGKYRKLFKELKGKYKDLKSKSLEYME